MIVLASQGASRRAMLEAAGVRFEVRPAHLDERAIEASLVGQPSAEIALALAEAKALAVSRTTGAALVLGSDSLIEVAGRRFDKAATKAEAAEHLRFFSGRTMRLHSAAAFARDGAIVWRYAAAVALAVRPLSDGYIADYLDAEWPAVAGCVGVFRIEGRGVQLFERVDGDHFSVLGMPLIPVLAALREFGELPA